MSKVLLFGNFSYSMDSSCVNTYAVIQPLASIPPLPKHQTMPWLHADYLSPNLMVVSVETFNVAYLLPAMPHGRSATFPQTVDEANYVMVMPKRSKWGKIGWD